MPSSASYWRRVWRHFKRNTLPVVGLWIALGIGLTLGALAGYFGGWVDLVISRLFELLLAVPTFFLLLTIAATLRPNIFYTMMVIGFTSWVGIARFTRNEFLRVRNLDYV